LVLATRRPRDKRWKSLCSQRRGRTSASLSCGRCRPRRTGRAATLNRMTGLLFGPVGTLQCFRRTGVRRLTRETGRADFHAVQFSKTACHVGTWFRPLTPTRPRVVGPESTVASVSPKHGCASAYRSTPHVLGVDCVRAIPFVGLLTLRRPPCPCQEHVPRWSSCRQATRADSPGVRAVYPVFLESQPSRARS
jgi:hypothetical protein